MANGNDTIGTKQIVAWIVVGLAGLVMLLLQFSVLGKFENIDMQFMRVEDKLEKMNDRTGKIETAVAELKASRQDDHDTVEDLKGEVKQLRDSFEASQQTKVNRLEQGLRSRDYALKHEREHSDNEERALTGALINRAQ